MKTQETPFGTRYELERRIGWSLASTKSDELVLITPDGHDLFGRPGEGFEELFEWVGESGSMMALIYKLDLTMELEVPDFVEHLRDIPLALKRNYRVEDAQIQLSFPLELATLVYVQVEMAKQGNRGRQFAFAPHTLYAASSGLLVQEWVPTVEKNYKEPGFLDAQHELRSVLRNMNIGADEASNNLLYRGRNQEGVHTFSVIDQKDRRQVYDRLFADKLDKVEV
jgi:hypothetical protein